MQLFNQFLEEVLNLFMFKVAEIILDPELIQEGEYQVQDLISERIWRFRSLEGKLIHARLKAKDATLLKIVSINELTLR